MPLSFILGSSPLIDLHSFSFSAAGQWAVLASFVFASGAFLAGFAFWKRAWASPNFSGKRSSFARRQLGIGKDPQHLLRQSLALCAAGSPGQGGQKRIQRVLGQRETELASLHAERGRRGSWLLESDCRPTRPALILSSPWLPIGRPACTGVPPV